MRRTVVALLLLIPACKPEPALHPHRPGVTIAARGQATASIVVMTQAIGETYSFSPETIIVRRDQPTLITFWNLQADDEHDVMLMDDHNAVLAQFKLPPLRKTARVFTFNREGLFPFVCTMHRPEMSGQILVVGPAK
jgi:plastocyanin